ncbi:MAG: thiolase family protein [Chloroflexi bacterium]|nr:thiolase family protein [Chloroflexota bacterium]
MSLKDKYCIVGAATTKFGRVPGVSPLGFTAEAVRLAVEDAGLKKGDIDAVLCKYPPTGFRSLWAHKVSQALGIQPKIAATVDQAGATNIGLVQYAMMAIDAGLITTAVCTYGDNPLSGPPGTYAAPRGSDAAFGLFGAPSGYAMIAQRHMIEYGTTSRQLGAIAVANRAWACKNPNAHMREPMTIEDHQLSRYVAWPLHLLDCCLVSDGGAAVVVTSAARARELRKPPVYIMGIGQHHIAWELPQRPTLTTSGAKISGELAFKMAGITPRDVDVCEIYDCFTITPLVTLEDYGFCAKGEGGPFVEDGKTGPGGSLPMNTSGGLLSESGMAGMQLVVEAVRQLRGECGERQVNGAEIALVSGQGGIMHTHATMVLRR